MSRKNGYMRVPTTEPTPVTQTRMKDMEKRRKLPKSLRPGLFYMFGERGKFAGERGSESEEEIELTEMKGEKRWRRPKIPKSPKSPKSPKLKKAKLKIKYISEPVQDGDTVQRMALRYGVPVSPGREGEREREGGREGWKESVLLGHASELYSCWLHEFVLCAGV